MVIWPSIIGYAYDDRWGKMKTKDFIKRRVIRLHPMVVMGAIIGAVMFYWQGCPVWDVSKVTIGALFMATFINALLLPATPGTEIRGLGEMYPLNGPGWSLFFEYIGCLPYWFFLPVADWRYLLSEDRTGIYVPGFR